MAEEKETAVTDEIKDVVTIEESGPCKKKVSVEIPGEKIKKALDEKYGELRKEVEMPGFRKGRAPLRLLEKRFGKEVSEQIKLKLLVDASESAVKDNELDILGEVDFDPEGIELPEEGAMKFEFEVEVRPEFELPELEGISVEKPTTEVDDEMIDEEIMAMRERAGIWAPKDKGKVEAEDQVVADVLLKIEGEAEEERHDDVEIFARKSGFAGPVPVANLDEVLAGAGCGDKKEVSVNVAESFFNEQYRGKKIDVEIEIKEIKRLEPAELDEGFFERFGVENEEELRERVGEFRRVQVERDVRADMNEQVYKYLLDNCKFELPVDVVADQSKRVLQREYTNLLIRGAKSEQVDERMDELRASSAERAEEQLRLFFIMSKVAEKLEVPEASEEEVNGYIAQVAASRGRRPEKMRQELARDGSLAQFKLQVREEKCIEQLLESANITEVEAGKKPKKTVKMETKKAEKKEAKKATRASTAKKRSKKS
ncbi:MAG TPA: trigger factor [Planctomycetes bacterium]|nr:trigger factor [Planctomycetota bacterium]HIJ72143.1 trigger factor [Planctomycetota bacterium]